MRILVVLTAHDRVRYVASETMQANSNNGIILVLNNEETSLILGGFNPKPFKAIMRKEM